MSTAEEALPEPSLSLLEYASLRAGLELLPDRAGEVASNFDLKDEEQLSREIGAWEGRLATRALEARELPVMKARMRDYWIRFDRKGVDDATPSMAPPPSPPPSTPPMQPPLQPPMQPPLLASSSVPEPPPIVTPPPMAPPASTSSFKKRLRLVRLVETVEAPSEPPAPPPLTIEGYALLCYASWHLPDRLQGLFEAFGLVTASQREEADRVWKARLQADPIAHGRWRDHFERLRVLYGQIAPANRA